MTHENAYFSNGNYEKRNSKLANVVFDRRYSYLRLSPAYNKIAGTNVKVGKTRLLALV